MYWQSYLRENKNGRAPNKALNLTVVAAALLTVRLPVAAALGGIVIRTSKLTVTLAFLLLSSRLAMAEAQPGNYIALHGEIAGCEPGIRVLDIAKVAPDGQVQFLDKYTIAVKGLNHKQITDRVTQAIANETGREPKSLQVSVVDGEDPAAIARLGLEAMVTWNCGRPTDWQPDSDHEKDRRVPPGERPRYENDYDERVAQAIPANWASALTRDPAALFVCAKSTSAESAPQRGRCL